MPAFLTIIVLLLLTLLYPLCYFFFHRLDKKNTSAHEDLLSLLPMLDCERCGYLSCQDYVNVLLEHHENNGALCPYQNVFDRDHFLRSLRQSGVNPLESSNRQGLIAQVFCQGGTNYESPNFNYDGLQQCTALHSLARSRTGCSQGCLGLGDCLVSCPENAISITKNGLAQIDKLLCTGCGRCISQCPTQVIKLLPRNADYYVACSATEESYRKNPSCKKLCTGCSECINIAPSNGFQLKNQLCHVNYQSSNDLRWKAAACCPNGSIIPLGENGQEAAHSKQVSREE